MLLGRKAELERVERVVREVGAGRSQALVIAGEAGVGKTALLEHLIDAASGCRVARVAGVQAEAELVSGPCTSSARRCSISSTSSPNPSATPWAPSSVCGAARPPTRSCSA